MAKPINSNKHFTTHERADMYHLVLLAAGYAPVAPGQWRSPTFSGPICERVGEQIGRTPNAVRWQMNKVLWVGGCEKDSPTRCIQYAGLALKAGVITTETYNNLVATHLGTSTAALYV